MPNGKKTVIVIGGGTAGITIANNLQDNFNVIVIEKSPYKDYPINYQIPLMIGFLFRNRNTKYIYNRNIKLSSGRMIPFFESNVLGGASVINGCVHMVGSESRWRRILGKFGLKYEELLKSYNKLYSTDSEEQGKINLKSPPQSVVDTAFIETLNRDGVPSGDMCFSNQESCGPISVTVKKYIRSSVMSLLQKDNFDVFCGEKVEGILLDDNGKITGIETDRRKIQADYVIMSAGVIETCDLLLRTKNRYADNSVLGALSIGEGMQDHTNLRVNVKANRKVGSLNEISISFYKKMEMLIRHFMGKPTLLVSTGASSAAHLDLDEDGEIDTRIQIVQFTETGRHGSDGKFFGDQPGFSISITAINPESRGGIFLDRESNVVDTGFLSSEKDVELLKLALKYCLRLLRSEPLSDYVLSIDKEAAIESDPVKYIMDNIFSGHHLNGGTHNAIGDNFEICGVKGLYVCDASVFGEYAASNIHSSVVLLSDMFSKKFVSINSSS